MTLVDVGSPVVLFSTRDKKFVSGLSKQEIYNYSVATSGEAHPWIASLWGTEYLAVGIGRMFRLIKIGDEKVGSHIWLDEGGNITAMTIHGGVLQISPHRWEEYSNSSYQLTPGLGEARGIFQLGNDKIFIKRENSIVAYDWDSETGAIGGKKWETSVNDAFYDFQWCRKYNELVIPNYNEYTVTLIKGGEHGGEVKATQDIGHWSGQVAIDKYGRYWFQEYHGNRITVCNPDDLSLANITINGKTYHGTFEVPFISYSMGISENSNFDIIMCDWSREYAAFFSADDDYSHIIRVYLGEESYLAAPLGEDRSFFISLGADFSKYTLLNPVNQVSTSGAVHDNPIPGQGDPGLARYKTWGRSWKPHVSAIYDYLFNPTES